MAPGWGDRDRSPNSRSSALSAPARCRRALDPRGSSQATRTSDDVRERAIVPNCGYFCSPEGKAHLRIKAAGRTASETGAVEGTERKSRKPGKAEPWERSKKSGPSCCKSVGVLRSHGSHVPRASRIVAKRASKWGSQEGTRWMCSMSSHLPKERPAEARPLKRRSSKALEE